jgi:hypothetical protein
MCGYREWRVIFLILVFSLPVCASAQNLALEEPLVELQKAWFSFGGSLEGILRQNRAAIESLRADIEWSFIDTGVKIMPASDDTSNDYPHLHLMDGAMDAFASSFFMWSCGSTYNRPEVLSGYLLGGHRARPRELSYNFEPSEIGSLAQEMSRANQDADHE